jgi:hypothetical protein
MAEYEITWNALMDHAWESDTHTFPSAVELEAIGQKGAPDVFARCEMRDGVSEVVDFRLTSKPDGRAVRTSDLNAWQPLEGLALNAFRQKARRFLKAGDPIERVGYQDEREFWTLGGQLAGAQASSSGPPDAELQEVAEIYRGAIEGMPTEAVQVMLGYSRRTAARRVQQARQRGFLPETTPGKKKG